MRTPIDLTSPRTIGQILSAALWLFARRPLLFILLAGIVVVPFELVGLLVSQRKTVTTETVLLLALANLALVTPFVTALQMQALLALGEGRKPAITSVVRRGLQVLPVVAAADIVAGLSEVVGLAFFVIPGIFIGVRLAVAGSVAATERTNWPGAIRRSLLLTQGNFLRVFALLAIQQVLIYLVASIIHGSNAVATQIIALALAVLVQAFGTLLINLLYFDLRARESTPVA